MRIREEEGKRIVPFWVKFLRFWPEFWVVVKEVDGELDCCSLRDGDSVDFNSLQTMTCIAVVHNITVKKGHPCVPQFVITCRIK